MVLVTAPKVGVKAVPALTVNIFVCAIELWSASPALLTAIEQVPAKTAVIVFPLIVHLSIELLTLVSVNPESKLALRDWVDPPTVMSVKAA